MKSSDRSNTTPETVIAELTRALGEEQLFRAADQPVDEAVSEFDFAAAQTYSHSQFHVQIGRLVQHVYAHADGRTLTLSQAQDEAVTLLAQFYEGTRSRGYDAAAVDAALSESGIRLVQERLIEVIKARRRTAYRRWILARSFDPLDWNQRIAIATLLKGHCEPYLPSELAGCCADRLAGNCLFTVLDIYLDLQPSPFL